MKNLARCNLRGKTTTKRKMPGIAGHFDEFHF
jgi:hypothetical protein